MPSNMRYRISWLKNDVLQTFLQVLYYLSTKKLKKTVSIEYFLYYRILET